MKNSQKTIIIIVISIFIILTAIWIYGGQPKDKVSGNTVSLGEYVYDEFHGPIKPVQETIETVKFIENLINKGTITRLQKHSQITTEPGVEYSIEPLWAYDPSKGLHASHLKISGKEPMPEFEPEPVQWRCYNSDGKDNPRRQWSNGWIGSMQSCGTSFTGQPKDWSCRGTDGPNATAKERLQVYTEKGCENGSCYTKTTEEVFEEFDCPYGCIQGNCLPKPVIKSNPMTTSPLEAGIADTIELDCTDSYDPDGEIEKCEWNLGDGTTKTGESITHSYDKEGSYEITLTVTDDKAATNTKTIYANIYQTNESPIACFEKKPITGIVGKTEFSFDASCSNDPDGEIISFEWDLGDGETKTGETITHIYTELIKTEKQYKITLTVTDNENAKASTSQKLIVYNTPPEAKYTAVPLYGIHPLTVVFTNNSTDPHGQKITKYSWDITGDGIEDYNTEHVIHTYTEPGEYNTTLTVWNASGGPSETVETTIAVYQLRAIKTLRAESINQGENLTIYTQCTGTQPKINYTIKKGAETIATYQNQDCGYITHGPINEPGLYEITATISGCTTIECRKTASFNVFEESPEETPVPEMHFLAVLIGAIAVIGITKKKS